MICTQVTHSAYPPYLTALTILTWPSCKLSVPLFAKEDGLVCRWAFYLCLDDFNRLKAIVLVNNQLDAQFFPVYVYFDTLHVSSNHMLIIRRINCINTSGICHSMYMTVWYAGMDGNLVVKCTDDVAAEMHHKQSIK